MSKISNATFDRDFTNKKPDFGVERTQGGSAAKDNLNVVVEEFFSPKGVLTQNTEHDAIVLAANQSINTSAKNNLYHVYVPMVHQSLEMPMILLSSKSPLAGQSSPSPKDAYNIEILTNFNDDTSCMESMISGKLNQGQMVKVVYGNVVGGVPSQGRIVKKMEGSINPEQAFIVFGVSDEEEGNLNSTSTSQGPRRNFSSSNRKKTSRVVPSPVKLSPDKLKKRNDKLAQSQAAPCREIFQNRSLLSLHNNYDGDMRVFTANCSHFKLMQTQMQQFINRTSGPNQAVNLLNKNGLGAEFKKIMLNYFVGSPYNYGGKAEFTGENRYVGGKSYQQGWGAPHQERKNMEYAYGNSGGGAKKRAIFGGKTYSEYWKSQGKLIKTAQGYRILNAFDCAALPPYLCLKCGFLLNIIERNLSRTNSNYPTNTRASQSFKVNIEQWASTPGLQGRYSNPEGHQFTSAGDGAELVTSGKYKGWYRVNYFNASGHFTKNAYKRGNSAMWVKYGGNGDRNPDNIYRWSGGRLKQVEFLLPWSMAYADHTGDFDKNA